MLERPITVTVMTFVALFALLAAIIISAKRTYDDPRRRLHDLPWWGYSAIGVIIHGVFIWKLL